MFRFAILPVVIFASQLGVAGAAFNSAKKAQVLWSDPGPVERLDLGAGPAGRAGQPRSPFRFIKEDKSGTSAKIFVRDARGRLWNVKFGDEVRAETFGSRLAWAAGYFAEPSYFVRNGRVAGVSGLSRRAARHVGPGGEFKDARFQLRDPRFRFLDENNWSWSYNPFVGTRELAGLKILLMLTSNWDNKDARDVDAGSNTAIFRTSSAGRPVYIYAFTDWGRTMGNWGSVFERSTWNCGDFADETPELVSVRLEGGERKLKWGYSGRHTREFARDIRVSDVRWFLQRFGRLRPAQIRAALIASGADRREADCFAGQLRARIEALRRAVE